jgi:hypothetical protein
VKEVWEWEEKVYIGKENFTDHNLEAEPMKEIEQNMGIKVEIG